MVCEALLCLALAQPDPAALVPLYRQALAERERQHGPDHPNVARSAADLGLYLRKIGDRKGAAEALARALAIDEKALGPDSAVTGEDLENLASVLPPAQAVPLYRRAAEHKQADIAARNLARVAAFEKDPEQAQALYRRALAKEEEASGATHPRVAVRLNDVALLLDDPKQAELLLRRALAIQQKELKRQHPETAATLNNLANVLLATGRVAAAEPLARQALSMLEETLGPAHARVATASSNLADVLRAKRDFNGAMRLYQRALAIDERVYGPDHPEVRVDRENVESLRQEMRPAK